MENKPKCVCNHPERWHELESGACHGDIICLCEKYNPNNIYVLPVLKTIEESMENNTERAAEEIAKEILDYSDHTSYRDKDHLLPSIIEAIESERAKTDKFMQELNTLRVQTVEKDAKIKALQNEVDTLLQGHAGDKGTVKSIGLENTVLKVKLLNKEGILDSVNNTLDKAEEEITRLSREIIAHETNARHKTNCAENCEKHVDELEARVAHLTSLVEKKDYALDKVIGFCVAFREDQPCWESHQDVGILFATARVARDITLPPIPEKGSN